MEGSLAFGRTEGDERDSEQSNFTDEEDEKVRATEPRKDGDL